MKIKNAQVAFRNSMGYVSKNRDTESLELNASIFANIASTGYDKNNIGPFILPWKEKAYVDKQIKRCRSSARMLTSRYAHFPAATSRKSSSANGALTMQTF